MSRAYRLGLRIVVVSLLIAAAAGLFVAIRVPPPAVRAAYDLGPSARPLGPLRLEERSGRVVTGEDLADRVVIASFIFTRCPLSCPRITATMKELQGRLAGSDVLLLSLSVDPQHDTPAVLSDYARRYGASPDRWWFLTGPKSAIDSIIRDRFQLSLMEAPAADPEMGVESIAHSDRLALVDRGRIVGLYESNDPQAVEALITRARRRALPEWVRLLPTVNAVLNALSAGFLLAGWFLIRRYRLGTIPTLDTPTQPSGATTVWDRPLVKAHIGCMVAAVTASALFLTSYLVYHFQAGSVPFPHAGLLRAGYFTILLSHTALATLSVPLILTTLFRAWHGDLARHRRIASVTFPVWLYVAITGVIIYWMLYHMPLGTAGSAAGPVSHADAPPHPTLHGQVSAVLDHHRLTA